MGYFQRKEKKNPFFPSVFEPTFIDFDYRRKVLPETTTVLSPHKAFNSLHLHKP